MSTIARLSLDGYERLIQTGVFDGPRQRRIELIHGEIREMSPIGTRHDSIVDELNDWSNAHLRRDRMRVRIQGSVGIPELQSAPQPDVVWLARKSYWLRRPQPEDVFLLIEVAETSLAYDRGEKTELYATAGIQDYWIVNIPSRAVEVHREPQRGRYRSTASHSGGDMLHPLRFPDAGLTVSKLFPPE